MGGGFSAGKILLSTPVDAAFDDRGAFSESFASRDGADRPLSRFVAAMFKAFAVLADQVMRLVISAVNSI